MLQATTVSIKDELLQIHRLNQENLKQHLSQAEKEQEGFVTWLYSVELLEQLHKLAPSIVVKEGDKVVGYALVMPKEARHFHPDLETFIRNTEQVLLNGKPLAQHNLYYMGQVCIDKNYRGKGVFGMLYQHHKKVYSTVYQYLITEISTSNQRSQRAHEKVGFKTFHTYRDAMDEWNIVAWDWS